MTRKRKAPKPPEPKEPRVWFPPESGLQGLRELVARHRQEQATRMALLRDEARDKRGKKIPDNLKHPVNWDGGKFTEQLEDGS
jgi:hypothetical protein|tara:strand:- start:8635 stop:8883 length:249 start_codon:yes stop_codon:yes gene_type:complete